MAWYDELLQASFNGVPFHIDSTARASGRKLVVSDFPLRDNPAQEDLGRLPRNFKIKAYFAGDLFAVSRALLEAALENSNGVGTLIHPTYGILNVWVGQIVSNEQRANGSFTTIDIEFSLDGGAPSPLSITDTASTLLGNLNDLVPYLEDAYIAGVGAMIVSSAVALIIGDQLTSCAAAFNNLPQSTIAGITPAFAASPTDSSATASAVLACFTAAGDNVVAAQAAPTASSSAVNGVTPAPAAVDASGGLTSMASFGSDVAPQPATAPPAQAVAQAAVITLVQGAALMASLTVYAQIDWQSAGQAEAAADELQDLLDAQVAAAADAGNFDLYRAWRALSAQAMADMRERAQGLPNLAAYNVGAALPSLALAQLLYQDGTQADALAALNGVVHPLFMPAAGNWLQPV